MLTRKSKFLLLKIFSLFSVVRGYNVGVIALAQYLSAIFILAPEKRAIAVILDWRLFILVFVSTLTIASGYIINSFYDSEKDLINRPKKSMLDRLVSQKTKLQFYFFLNFLAFGFAFIISFRAAIFYGIYIFLIWLYSHKLKRITFIGNIMASFLAVLPFFGILMYFKNFYQVIFAHATFLILLILIREITKDLENISGDFSSNYQTIPVKYSEKTAKYCISIISILTFVPIYILIDVFFVGYMDIYFYITLLFLLFFNIQLWQSYKKEDYLKLHNYLKLIIFAGIVCIVLIEPLVLLNGKNLIYNY